MKLHNKYEGSPIHNPNEITESKEPTIYWIVLDVSKNAPHSTVKCQETKGDT